MVTIIGSVRSRNDNSPDPCELRHFIVETSVYDASKAAPVQFSVACFLENTKRWHKVKTPPRETFLSVTAKVAGRTTDTNHLALRVLDLAYLPRPSSAAATLTPALTPPSKRSAHWDNRAPSSTPSKKARVSEPVNRMVSLSDINTTPLEQSTSTSPGTTGSAINLPRTEDTTESPSARASAPTTTDPPTSDNGTRPHRNRHLPRKYTDQEQTTSIR